MVEDILNALEGNVEQALILAASKGSSVQVNRTAFTS